MNALLDQTKSEQWPVGLPAYCDKVRLQPLVAEVLDEARPATVGKGDQLIHGALKLALIAAIVAGDFRWVHGTVGKLIGADAPAGKPLPEREAEARRPLSKAVAR
jgi:hypothetical protein